MKSDDVCVVRRRRYLVDIKRCTHCGKYMMPDMHIIGIPLPAFIRSANIKRVIQEMLDIIPLIRDWEVCINNLLVKLVDQLWFSCTYTIY